MDRSEVKMSTTSLEKLRQELLRLLAGQPRLPWDCFKGSSEIRVLTQLIYRPTDASRQRQKGDKSSGGNSGGHRCRHCKANPPCNRVGAALHVAQSEMKFAEVCRRRPLRDQIIGDILEPEVGVWGFWLSTRLQTNLK